MEQVIESRCKIDENNGSFTVIGNRVLLQPEAEEDKYVKGGLVVVPEDWRKWAHVGILKAVGSKVDNSNYGFVIGKKYYYKDSMRGIDIEINGVRCKMLSPGEIDCEVEE